MFANKYPQQQNIISKSVGYSFFGFIILLFFTPFTRLEIGINIWIGLVIALVVFAYFDNLAQSSREKVFHENFYPPEYNYYKSFLITLIVLYSLVLLFSRNLIFQILSIIVFSLIASLISIIPYLRSSMKNQKFELFYQKKQISELTKKVDSISALSETFKPVQLHYDSITGEPVSNVSTQELKSTFIAHPESKRENNRPIVRFDSQTGRPLTEEEMNKENNESKELVSNINQQKTSPLNAPVEINRNIGMAVEQNKANQYMGISSDSRWQTDVDNRTGARQQPINQFTKTIFLIVSENFAGYLFFGEIIFLFIA